MKAPIRLFWVLFLAGNLTLCSLGSSSNSDNTTLGLAFLFLNERQALVRNQSEFVKMYAKLAFETYKDSHTAASEFQNSVNEFVNKSNRTQADFNALKTKWRLVRIPYLQTEAFRFSGGPIDNPELTDNTELEPLINAWPLDEGHIDGLLALGGFTKESLIEANEGTCANNTCPDNDESKNISIGWHAIEYILWGVDPPNNTTSGGRLLSDFGTVTPNPNGTPEARKLAYLQMATEILTEHLEILKRKWDPEQDGSYAKDFTSNPKKSLDQVLRGMARFAGGEWGGERMTGVFEGDQEEEHSCFSDNTKHDFYYNAVGFETIFTGTYKGEKLGTGLEVLFGREANTVKEDLEISKRFCLNEYDEDPSKNPTTCPNNTIESRFDRMIASLGSNGTLRENQDYNRFRNEIQPAVQRIAKTFQKVAGRLGVNIGDDGLVLPSD